jgi:diguanylate cyclase
MMDSLPLLFEHNEGKHCFAMIDIDHFKQFNDTYGHLVGDKVLRFVANIIKNSIKGSDFVARYGGEEFVVVFTGTGIGNAIRAAENVRSAIEKTRFVLKKENQNLGTISVSIGLSEYRADEELETCLERADKALYQAKQTGRNRVITEATLA